LIKHEYLVPGLILFLCLGTAWGISAVSKEYLAGGTPGLIQTPVPSSPKYLVFTELDNGTTARIHTRDIITVRLSENPTTGYRWNITTGPGLMTLDDTYIYTNPEGRMTGAGGVRFLTLEARMTGSEQISGIYKRSWEDTRAGIRVFSMTFVVT
jgi:inhibitor of cysteine peptidase